METRLNSLSNYKNAQRNANAYHQTSNSVDTCLNNHFNRNGTQNEEENSNVKMLLAHFDSKKYENVTSNRNFGFNQIRLKNLKQTCLKPKEILLATDRNFKSHDKICNEQNSNERKQNIFINASINLFPNVKSTTEARNIRDKSNFSMTKTSGFYTNRLNIQNFSERKREVFYKESDARITEEGNCKLDETEKSNKNTIDSGAAANLIVSKLETGLINSRIDELQNSSSSETFSDKKVNFNLSSLRNETNSGIAKLKDKCSKRAISNQTSLKNQNLNLGILRYDMSSILRVSSNPAYDQSVMKAELAKNHILIPNLSKLLSEPQFSFSSHLLHSFVDIDSFKLNNETKQVSFFYEIIKKIENLIQNTKDSYVSNEELNEYINYISDVLNALLSDFLNHLSINSASRVKFINMFITCLSCISNTKIACLNSKIVDISNTTEAQSSKLKHLDDKLDAKDKKLYELKHEIRSLQSQNQELRAEKKLNLDDKNKIVSEVEEFKSKTKKFINGIKLELAKMSISSSVLDKLFSAYDQHNLDYLSRFEFKDKNLNEMPENVKTYYKYLSLIKTKNKNSSFVGKKESPEKGILKLAAFGSNFIDKITKSENSQLKSEHSPSKNNHLFNFGKPRNIDNGHKYFEASELDSNNIKEESSNRDVSSNFISTKRIVEDRKERFKLNSKVNCSVTRHRECNNESAKRRDIIDKNLFSISANQNFDDGAGAANSKFNLYANKGQETLIKVDMGVQTNITTTFINSIEPSPVFIETTNTLSLVQKSMINTIADSDKFMKAVSDMLHNIDKLAEYRDSSLFNSVSANQINAIAQNLGSTNPVNENASFKRSSSILNKISGSGSPFKFSPRKPYKLSLISPNPPTQDINSKPPRNDLLRTTSKATHTVINHLGIRLPTSSDVSKDTPLYRPSGINLSTQKSSLIKHSGSVVAIASSEEQVQHILVNHSPKKMNTVTGATFPSPIKAIRNSFSNTENFFETSLNDLKAKIEALKKNLIYFNEESDIMYCEFKEAQLEISNLNVELCSSKEKFIQILHIFFYALNGNNSILNDELRGLDLKEDNSIYTDVIDIINKIKDKNELIKQLKEDISKYCGGVGITNQINAQSNSVLANNLSMIKRRGTAIKTSTASSLMFSGMHQNQTGSTSTTGNLNNSVLHKFDRQTSNSKEANSNNKNKNKSNVNLQIVSEEITVKPNSMNNDDSESSLANADKSEAILKHQNTELSITQVDKPSDKPRTSKAYTDFTQILSAMKKPVFSKSESIKDEITHDDGAFNLYSNPYLNNNPNLTLTPAKLIKQVNIILFTYIEDNFFKDAPKIDFAAIRDKYKSFQETVYNYFSKTYTLENLAKKRHAEFLNSIKNYDHTSTSVQAGQVNCFRITLFKKLLFGSPIPTYILTNIDTYLWSIKNLLSKDVQSDLTASICHFTFIFLITQLNKLKNLNALIVGKDDYNYCYNRINVEEVLSGIIKEHRLEEKIEEKVKEFVNSNTKQITSSLKRVMVIDCDTLISFLINMAYLLKGLFYTELKAVFMAVDIENKGYLSKLDYVTALQLVSSINNSKEVLRYFNTYSVFKENDLVMTLDQFVESTIQNGLYSKQILIKTLKIHDGIKNEAFELIMLLNKQLTSNMRTIFDSMRQRLLYLQESNNGLGILLESIYAMVVCLKEKIERFNAEHSKETGILLGETEEVILWLSLVCMDNLIYSIYVHYKQKKFTEVIDSFSLKIDYMQFVLEKDDQDNKLNVKPGTKYKGRMSVNSGGLNFSGRDSFVARRSQLGSSKFLLNLIAMDSEVRKDSNKDLNLLQDYSNQHANYESLLINYIEKS